MPPPPGAAPGPGLPPPPVDGPEPPRASWWSVAAVFVTLVLSGVVLVSLSKGSEAADVSQVVATTIGGLALGAVLANVTSVGRVFRRWSSIVVAMLVGIVLLIGLGAVGGGALGRGGAMAVLGLLSIIAALDLCYVSRLRVMVVLSGLCMIPVVAALESSGLFSGFAWFTSAMFALWLLSVDEQRSLPRPEPVDGIPITPRARGADLVRTVAMALLAGFTLAFLMSSPSCSFRPLANALDWLPWHPNISPKYSPGLDQPVRLPELDGDGHETIPYLDREGRRLLIDPYTAEPYGMVDRDGGTVVVARDGREVARFDDGGLEVADPAGGSLRFERDDQGWYVDAAEGQRFRVVPSYGEIELQDRNGEPVARSTPGSSGTVRIEPWADDVPGLDRLDPDGDGRIPVPNAPILHATTGAGRQGNEASPGDGTTTIYDESGEERRYRDGDGDEVDVEIVPGYGGGSEHRYRVDRERDRITVYDEDGQRVLSLDVDREGNALDGIGELDDIDLDESQPDTENDRPSPPWRAIAIVVAVLAAIGGGIACWIWWRRRQGEPDQADRDWAEEQVRKVEAWGRDHTFPRERAETIVRYVARLDHEIARDGSLHEVGDVLDDALFGRRPLSLEVRQRTAATIDRLIEDHPKPGRAERLRGGPDHGDDREPVGTSRRS